MKIVVRFTDGSEESYPDFDSFKKGKRFLTVDYSGYKAIIPMANIKIIEFFGVSEDIESDEDED